MYYKGMLVFLSMQSHQPVPLPLSIEDVVDNPLLTWNQGHYPTPLVNSVPKT